MRATNTPPGACNSFGTFEGKIKTQRRKKRKKKTLISLLGLVMRVKNKLATSIVCKYELSLLPSRQLIALLGHPKVGHHWPPG